jgi:hypothetical protein
MMRNVIKRISRICPLCFALAVLLAGCAPVNFLTRVKRVPRAYSINYNCPNVKAERTELNKRAWVVYSDRAGNTTTIVPGGSLPHTGLKFMEPMLVIGKRGDYFRLIRYDAGILDNERLSDRKAAQYCGWLHKDRLLLYGNGLTEVRNRIRLKNITAVTDRRHILHVADYAERDSLILYTGPELKERGKAVGLHAMMYLLKPADEGKKVLVAGKSDILPGEAGALTVGWMDAGLIAPFGQRLALAEFPFAKTGERTDSFSSRGRDSLIHARFPASFHPVLYADRKDTALTFRTLDAGRILDYSDNRIANVDGEPVTYRQSETVKSQLRDINIILAFDMSETVLSRLDLFAGIVRGMTPVFDGAPSMFRFRYAAVLGDRLIPLHDDWLSFCSRLAEACGDTAQNRQGDGSGVLNRAVSIAGLMPAATNLIVHVGEKSDSADPSAAVMTGFAANNCRLLGFQVFADNSNTYNNFVLHATAVIERYAEAVKREKRRITVNASQLRTENRFREGSKNSYSLDYPVNSMTQGMVIFPEKGFYTDPELLVAGVDSLVRQIEYDNTLLMNSLDKAFARAGNDRTKFDRVFADRFRPETDRSVIRSVCKAFPEVSPQWMRMTERVRIPVDTVNLKRMALLLSEPELASLSGFIEKLSARQPDLKGMIASSGQKRRRVQIIRKELRGIPPDMPADGVYSRSAEAPASRRLAVSRYVNTRPLRRALKREYLRELRKCVFEGCAGKVTLAAAQEYITTAPTLNPELNRIRIRDLLNRRVLTDPQLDALIRHYMKSKKRIEELAVPEEEITSPDGEKYFLLPVAALP